MLFDNGPLVNSPGTGVGGTDESVLQNITLGMTNFGFAHQRSSGNRVADDFTVTFITSSRIGAVNILGHINLWLIAHT